MFGINPTEFLVAPLIVLDGLTHTLAQRNECAERGAHEECGVRHEPDWQPAGPLDLGRAREVTRHPN
ncbi:MAG: hypothetical protein COZ06_37420 [Armatimonadetes bacterium CG_4_10_14_3_um_filter_66_18]|nr:hypothetical protein [Armatimonadota bacterium]OIP04175.1 MAG: hypothetical protein AUJ96_13425 [Armatimonadetes bacterium CG2_30_66_41]PIU95726.1 MAG: hypothetical protein COS65_00935 [Armatimonadetes bacterium CG06_land_8_20_14_3_00_66_21]PIX44435.1 MAG: hypothetical protein COZ57_17540 [Armatimonadetes bacterium CG_4_8_14_3_um_filter_66_20]PIY35871.1 MAG: hypothetical protein COZ06_37420 [Armatimonadetes bacterium CG_4_10_14_3_um_filter_66_18]PIZ39071.1 MAG: hypothetical protein COY42_22